MKLRLVSSQPSAAAERYRRQFRWHPFFVLWPRVVRDHDTRRRVFVWLQTIERRRIELGPVQWRIVDRKR